MNRRGNAISRSEWRAAKGHFFGAPKKNEKLKWISKAIAMRLCKPLASHACANDGG
jgi:hypothetical protein